MTTKPEAEPSGYQVGDQTFVNPEWIEQQAEAMLNNEIGGDVMSWDDALYLTEALDKLSSAIRARVTEEVKRELVRPGNRTTGVRYLYGITKPSPRTYVNADKVRQYRNPIAFPDLYQTVKPDNRAVRRLYPPKKYPELYDTKTGESAVKIERLAPDHEEAE